MEKEKKADSVGRTLPRSPRLSRALGIIHDLKFFVPNELFLHYLRRASFKFLYRAARKWGADSQWREIRYTADLGQN